MYVLKSQLNIGYWLGLHVAGWSLTGTCLEFAVGLTITGNVMLLSIRGLQ